MFLAPLLLFQVSNQLFFSLDLTLGYGQLFAFAQVVMVVKELFDSSTKQEGVIKSFFREKLGCFSACAFVIHVEDYELFGLVFEVENFRDHLVTTDVRGRVVDRFFNAP
jgi:hypothetical protein